MVDQCVCYHCGINRYLCLNAFVLTYQLHKHHISASFFCLTCSFSQTVTNMDTSSYITHLYLCTHNLSQDPKTKHMVYLKYGTGTFYFSPMRTYRHLCPLSMDCCHLCGVKWVQLSPLTARCMQLNHIKVISPTEVIASRWLPGTNMVLIKLLSHCGCVRGVAEGVWF